MLINIADYNKTIMNETISFRMGGQEREFLLVEVMARSYPQSLDYDDGNWLTTQISVQAGAFAGSYHASLRCEEFARFLSSLRLVEASFGTDIPAYAAEFDTMEGQLSIVIRGDVWGHFTASCVAVDDFGARNRLEFTLAFDRTYLPAMLDELEAIIQAFPVRGKPSD